MRVLGTYRTETNGILRRVRELRLGTRGRRSRDRRQYDRRRQAKFSTWPLLLLGRWFLLRGLLLARRIPWRGLYVRNMFRHCQLLKENHLGRPLDQFTNCPLGGCISHLVDYYIINNKQIRCLKETKQKDQQQQQSGLTWTLQGLSTSQLHIVPN